MVANEKGRVAVLEKIGANQGAQGAALTNDSIVGSVDAEVLAVGPSGKGPGRGAILRHGSFTLWGFEVGPVKLTPAGEALFVNVVAYAAKQVDRPVLETRRNGTRDNLLGSVAFARKNPGYVKTIRRLYVPESLGSATVDEIEKWVTANRPWLRTEGRRFVVDDLARSLDVPNHRRAYLERLIANLAAKRDVERTLAALRRSTGQTELTARASGWRTWYRENRDYLYFSDCEGFVFKIDEEAKKKRVPFERLRGWSSEEIDYRLP